MLRGLNVILMLTLVVSAFFLYSLEHKSKDIERQISGVEKKIAAERAAIKLLEAEQSFLMRPDRIQKLAEKHLKVAPVKAEQFVSYKDLDKILPERKAEPVADPTALDNQVVDPIANLLKEKQ